MSTVLDVAVCLLLVGAAVATLAVATGPVDDDGAAADRTAATLATVTTGVPAGTDRRAHDTLAGHLSTAVIENATFDDEPLTEAEYPGAVRAETAALTGDRVFVTARWEPYPGAPLQGRLVAGNAPPPDADVAATSLTLDGGFAPIDEPPPESFRTLADAVATAYVGWLFPTERTRAALVDARTSPAQAARYRTVAGTLEASVDGAVVDAAVRQANAELTAALAARLESDLRARYGSVAAAREDVTLDEVEVVVRRWES